MQDGKLVMRFIEQLNYGDRNVPGWHQSQETGNPEHDIKLAFQVMEQVGVDTEPLDWRAVISGKEDAIIRMLCAIRYAFPRSVPEKLRRSSLQNML
jgi:hypothetical protein